MYFTTPTLDFSTHANALNHIIEELYQEYPGFRATDKIYNVNIVLYVFDLLTKLPTKRWIVNNNNSNNALSSSSLSSLDKSENEQKLNSEKQEYINRNPVIKIIHKYLTDFDIEEEKEWKVQKEKLMSKPSELYLSNHNFDPTLSNEQKAFYHYLRGHLYNIFDYYHYLAEKNLSTAIKLDPNLSEAWSELAECYLKKHLLKRKSQNSSSDFNNTNSSENNQLYTLNLELTLAKHCLERALKLKPTNKTLNNMALTLRKIKTNYSEYISNINKSIDLSKTAISFDVNNCLSWGIIDMNNNPSLGMSYLEKFFNISRDTSDLKSSLKAYTIAISHCKKENSLDMLLNKFMINSYLENYQESLNNLRLINKYIKEEIFNAESYPSLSFDELYNNNTNQISKLEQYTKKISSLIKNKCNIKDKYFLKITWGHQNILLDTINKKSNNKNNNDNKSKEKKSFNSHIESTIISNLKIGKNPMKYIRLRIISEVTTVFGYNRSFIAVDETNNYTSLSIYNLKNNIPLIGQEILIFEPEYNIIKITYNTTIEYNVIRIDLYTQKSLQYDIETEVLKQTSSILEMKESNANCEYTLEQLKRLNLIIHNEFLDDMKDLNYSKSHQRIEERKIKEYSIIDMKEKDQLYKRNDFITSKKQSRLRLLQQLFNEDFIGCFKIQTFI
ncbi:hypothetical protein BCR32DRAFT_288812 [Anaeromyces robustus]|uniref:Tetratricopeptide repeat protein 5 OB fold domain-containing protein n=1 Tax=Anaeromyces robustus TaxID=1754192 RepID=A0A1Y1XRC6_9FUNG|nr:hypothetical protein BCR32DRAFT_288812 [Anaeromyces robustus]|eukprot:ORX88308.1 hypothetical protein BCR32DRAFT_288812 [Anaeromyces robustus]